jgi:hypothetical protein
MSKVTSVVKEWVRTVEIGEKLKTTDEDGTDVGRSVVGNGNGHGLDYDRVLLHAPVRGVRMEACDCEILRQWWGDYKMRIS